MVRLLVVVKTIKMHGTYIKIIEKHLGYEVAQLVRFPVMSLEFFIDNPSGRNMALALTQSRTEMSIKIISWG